MTYRQRRFDRASHSYDGASDTQKNMAERLFSLLEGLGPFPSIAELGCGTGHFSRHLSKGFGETFLVTDSSEAMLGKCRENFNGSARDGMEWRQVDAAQVLPFSGMDLICSNALVQWIEDLAAHFSHVHRALNASGLFLFSGFCESNFPELREVLRRPPFLFDSFPGHSLETVINRLKSKGFLPLRTEQETLEKTFPDGESFIRALRDLGATGRPGFVMTRSRWEGLMEEYEREAGMGKAGVRVTWKPWYVLARKDR